MSGIFKSRCKVAVVGYAQSPIARHAAVPLGALTLWLCAFAVSAALPSWAASNGVAAAAVTCTDVPFTVSAIVMPTISCRPSGVPRR